MKRRIFDNNLLGIDNGSEGNPISTNKDLEFSICFANSIIKMKPLCIFRVVIEAHFIDQLLILNTTFKA